MDNQIAGILNLVKPTGITSRELVTQVSRTLKLKKVGHAGTLDPLASGVVVVCVGAATRLIEYIQRYAKEYEARFLLGCRSDTEDVEGEVTHLADAAVPTESQIKAVLPQFKGRTLQTPPAYSAKRIGGRRAYKLARQGVAVELQPVPIRVDELDLLKFDYPEVELKIVCGSGTYVRSLGRDIAKKLESAAVMSALVRTAIGPFTLSAAVSTQDLDRNALLNALQPMKDAVAYLPSLRLPPAAIVKLNQGQFLAAEQYLHAKDSGKSTKSKSQLEWAILDDKAEPELRAIAHLQDGLLRPKRVFST